MSMTSKNLDFDYLFTVLLLSLLFVNVYEGMDHVFNYLVSFIFFFFRQGTGFNLPLSTDLLVFSRPGLSPLIPLAFTLFNFTVG